MLELLAQVSEPPRTNAPGWLLWIVAFVPFYSAWELRNAAIGRGLRIQPRWVDWYGPNRGPIGRWFLGLRAHKNEAPFRYWYTFAVHVLIVAGAPVFVIWKLFLETT